MKAGEWDGMRVKFGYRNCFGVDRRGLSGGLALLWGEDVEVEIKSYSRYHIDAVVHTEVTFKLTLFYGNPCVSRREESWRLLRRIMGDGQDAWLVMGDFNEVTHSSEMVGKRDRDSRQMRRFREVLMECSLCDIGFHGPKFTFSNRRKGGEESKARLDRFLANKEWMNLFPKALALNGWALHSDHRPIILFTQGRRCRGSGRSPPSFRFEPMWFRHNSFREEVQSIWNNEASRVMPLSEKLSRCGEKLLRWNETTFGNVQRNIKQIKEHIDALQRQERTITLIQEEAAATAKLDEWLAREELLWKQRSRAEWLKAGDRNTTFFKAKSTQRRDKKLINRLETDGGHEVNDTASILNEVTNHFNKLFQATSGGNDQLWREALTVVPRKVSEEMNLKLKQQYTAEEVRTALFQMHPTKAPDDCLLFLKASLHSLQALKHILSLYERASGQQVNFQKSELSVSKNMDGVLKVLVAEFMGMKLVEKHSKYLGLPLGVGQNKREAFRWLEDTMAKRIQDWKHLLLSAAGKEVLIKSCLQAIPLYSMSCFKIPKTLCDKFSSMAIQFWWSSGTRDRGIHWVSREILQKDKAKGGLGLRCFEAMNIAMTMKQLWRFIQCPEQLVSKVFKAKYFKKGDLLNAKARPYDSHVWKCLTGSLEIFKSGLVRNGEADNWRWKGSVSGLFTVKSAYMMVRDWQFANGNYGGEPSNLEEIGKAWRRLWRVKVPDRAKLLLWRLYHNALPVGENLRRRGCGSGSDCCFCGYKFESVFHLFIECWWAKEFWRKMELRESNIDSASSAADWVWFHMVEGNMGDLKKILVGVWTLWFNRNLWVHGKTGMGLDWCHIRTMTLLQQFERKGLLGVEGAIDQEELEQHIVIKCDGSWSSKSEVGGYAAVAFMGDTILGCKAKWRRSCSSALETECLAIVEGLLLAEEGGWSSVIIASDSSEAVWALQAGRMDASELLVFQKGMELLSANPSWKISPIFREDNSFADLLAKRARRMLWSWEDLLAIPICLSLCRV